MKVLPVRVKNKAIEIANALIGEKINEGTAIATAIRRAKGRAADRGKKFEEPRQSRITDVKEHGEDRFVIPHGERRAI